MTYPPESFVGRFLENDPEALQQVLRWISTALTSPRFWSLRGEWPDLMQEVLARVVESLRLNRFDPARDFRSYVQGIARFTCLQALGRWQQTSHSGVPSTSTEIRAVTPESEVIDRQLVRRILDLATEDCRELFHLYFFEMRGYEEIAQALGVPLGTVKSRLFRCLECAHHGIAPRALRHSRKVGEGRRTVDRRAKEPLAGRYEY